LKHGAIVDSSPDFHMQMFHGGGVSKHKQQQIAAIFLFPSHKRNRRQKKPRCGGRRLIVRVALNGSWAAAEF
jgi:hypothetical protein